MYTAFRVCLLWSISVTASLTTLETGEGVPAKSAFSYTELSEPNKNLIHNVRNTLLKFKRGLNAIQIRSIQCIIRGSINIAILY